MNYGNLHTINCAPIQCTVWPRNGVRFRPLLRLLERTRNNPQKLNLVAGYIAVVFFTRKQ